MSDLISRSALIEALKNEPKYSIELPAYMGDSIQKLLNVNQKMIVDVVKKQPTAYDVEKVVAELEEAKQKNFKAYKETTDTFDVIAYGNVVNAYGNAIDIVKVGGA